jgi:hypothetical protein
MGVSEYPLLRFSQIKGLAVGRITRYPLPRQICLLEVQATGITDSIP